MVAKETIRNFFVRRFYGSKPRPLIFIVVFSISGSLALIFIRAAVPSSPIEPETRTVTGNVSVINDSGASNGKAIRFTTTPNQSLTRIRAAFYYPWFSEAWNQQGFNPFTNYTPSLGYYSSTDAAVISSHVDELIYAGMNSAIYSWWGQGSKEDTRFTSYLNATGSRALKWAVYYECEGNTSGGTCGSVGGPAPGVASIQSDLSYIRTKYASDPHYMYFSNKPVVFVYGDGSDSCTTATNWKTANTNLGSPFFIVLKVFGGYAGCADQPDNWHQYGPASAQDVQAGHSIAISPGYWKKGCQPINGGSCTQGGTQPYLARDLTRWQQNVTNLKNSTLPIQLVTTFNEWGEGSIIESANEWSSASGHGSYIDILHNTLASTPDTQAPTAPTNLTAMAVSVSQVNLSWMASTDNVGVAQYEILRNDSVINTVSPTNSASDTTVAANTAYTYTVLAKDAAGNRSPNSNSATVTTPDASTCTTAPTAPTNLVTSAPPSGSSVNVSWNASVPGQNCTLGSYLIFRSVSGGGSSLAATVPSTNLSWVDTGVTYGTTYIYYLVAQDTNSPPHQSPSSSSLSITTPTCIDAVVPNNPPGLVYASTTSSVTLTWQAANDAGACGVAGYRVYQVVSGSDVEIANVLAGQSLTVTRAGLTAGTDYTFRVKAYDSSSPVNMSTPSSISATTQTGGAGIVIAIAGDIQKPRSDLHYALDTVNVIKNQINPAYILGLGDMQYESGSISDFQNYYSRTYGQAGVGSKVYPTPGNHDYATSGATGYYSYFNAGNNTINGNTVAGPANSGYYAFNVGTNWRVYSMNSETAGSTATIQNNFLINDITSNAKACSIMFYHKPYYDYGTTHDGDGDSTLPWLKSFYDRNGDVVLTGHEHNYQRFKMTNPYTNVEDTARGLRSWVVGTGGADNLYGGFGSTLHGADSLIVASNGSSAWGVLKMVLHDNNYDWEFLPINTGGYTDSGSGQCH